MRKVHRAHVWFVSLGQLGETKFVVSVLLWNGSIIGRVLCSKKALNMMVMIIVGSWKIKIYGKRGGSTFDNNFDTAGAGKA